MNDSTLQTFRQIASDMGIGEGGWEWVGPHMSQRLFGISKERAESYAKRFGGLARPEISAEALADYQRQAWGRLGRP